MTLQERFWEKVNKIEGGCWEWMGCLLKSGGYGGFTIKKHARPIPEGLHVLHKCDNPKCVRPDHLFLGTPKDNVQDMMLKGRNGNAKFTDDQVRRLRRHWIKHKTPMRRISEFLGISIPSLHKILTGRSYKHVPME